MHPAAVALLLASVLACVSGERLYVLLRTAQDRYLTVAPDGIVTVAPEPQSVTDWGRQHLALEHVSTETHRFTIRTWLGTYVGASREGVVAANATAVTSEGVWTFHCEYPVQSRCSLQSAYGTYMTTKGGQDLRCDSPVPEIFEVVARGLM
eukprot:m51a1_g12706 hypothetical protein (151) ;mRNA; f:2768-3220